jgi:hypothetical protein
VTNTQFYFLLSCQITKIRNEGPRKLDYSVGLAKGVLDGLPCGLVHQGEGRVPFLVLDASAPSHILDPVLHAVNHTEKFN